VVVLPFSRPLEKDRNMPCRAFHYAVALLCVAAIAVVAEKSAAPINAVLNFGSESWDLVKNGEVVDLSGCLVSPEFPINITISTTEEEPLKFIFYHMPLEDKGEYYSLDGIGDEVSASSPLTISLSLSCEDAFVDPILLSLFFDNYKSITMSVPVICYIAGCDEACDVHGTCINSTGYCQCDSPWQGTNCASVLKMKKYTYCPGETVEFEFALANVVGEEWYTVWSEVSELQVFDYNYLYDVVPEGLTVGKPFPEKNNGDTYKLQIPSLIPPGPVRLELFADNDYTFLTSLSFTVLPYSDSRCFGEKANCTKTECKNGGTCNEESGLCDCVNTRNYWFDCSRGCEELTIVNDSEGTIDSGGGADPPLYNTDTLCTWIISPKNTNFDYIKISFERFEATNGDRVKIMTVDDANAADLLLDSFSGYTRPDERRYDYKKIAVVLETDYTSYGHGFLLKYETVNVIPTTGIVIGCVAGAVVIIAIIVLLLIRRRSLTSTAVEKARHVRSVALPPTVSETDTQTLGGDDSFAPDVTESTDGDDSSAGKLKKSSSSRKRLRGELEPTKSTPSMYALPKKTSVQPLDENSLGWSDMKGLEVKTHILQFNLESQATFPVMEDQTESVMFSNTSSKPLQFRISHPVDENVYECYAEPGMGTLLSGYGVCVVFHFKLKYTTRVTTKFQVEVWNNNSGSTIAGFCGFSEPDKPADCIAFIGTELEGAMSERLDPNEIVLNSEPLGVGAFGVVYPGQYRQSLVAVKVMSRQQDLLEQIISDFEKEIELYKKLRNPLLVEFVGASLVPGKLCMVTELIKHGSLEQLVNEAEIPFALQTKFALNIAEAVEYLHVNNVLYRDLKPSNVMIVSTSLKTKINCKIGDFGTARNVKDVTELFTYTTGQGTPIYMAPEILDVSPYNHKADIYSYAITLWQVFCREKPWSHTAVWNIPTLVISGKRPDIPSAMPKDYAALIRSCWSPSVDARPDFRSVIEKLQPIAKKAKKDFKADPSGEQMLRKLQNATASGPVVLSPVESNNPSKVRKGIPTFGEKSTFNLGLTDVSTTTTAVDKKATMSSNTSMSSSTPMNRSSRHIQRPSAVVVPEEILPKNETPMSPLSPKSPKSPKEEKEKKEEEDDDTKKSPRKDKHEHEHEHKHDHEDGKKKEHRKSPSKRSVTSDHGDGHSKHHKKHSSRKSQSHDDA